MMLCLPYCFGARWGAGQCTLHTPTCHIYKLVLLLLHYPSLETRVKYETQNFHNLLLNAFHHGWSLYWSLVQKQPSNHYYSLLTFIFLFYEGKSCSILFIILFQILIMLFHCSISMYQGATHVPTTKNTQQVPGTKPIGH